jgi:hypothetical protein
MKKTKYRISKDRDGAYYVEENNKIFFFIDNWDRISPYCISEEKCHLWLMKLNTMPVVIKEFEL